MRLPFRFPRTINCASSAGCDTPRARALHREWHPLAPADVIRTINLDHELARSREKAGNESPEQWHLATKNDAELASGSRIRPANAGIDLRGHNCPVLRQKRVHLVGGCEIEARQ